MIRNQFFNKVRVYYPDPYSFPAFSLPTYQGLSGSITGTLPGYSMPQTSIPHGTPTGTHIPLGPAYGPEHVPNLFLGPPIQYTVPKPHTIPIGPTTPTTFIPIDAPMHGPTYNPGYPPYGIFQGIY